MATWLISLFSGLGGSIIGSLIIIWYTSYQENKKQKNIENGMFLEIKTFLNLQNKEVMKFIEVQIMQSSYIKEYEKTETKQYAINIYNNAA